MWVFVLMCWFVAGIATTSVLLHIVRQWERRS